MKITINQEACIGCGMCQSLCDKCFILKGDKAEVIKEDGCEECDIQEVIDNCPVNAIKKE